MCFQISPLLVFCLKSQKPTFNPLLRPVGYFLSAFLGETDKKDLDMLMEERLMCLMPQGVCMCEAKPEIQVAPSGAPMLFKQKC